MSNVLVWGEIPVRDLKAGAAFYGEVTGHRVEIQEMGPMVYGMFMSEGDGPSINIYEGKPAAPGTGSIQHIGVPKLEEALARVPGAGGEVTGEITQIPPGRFCFIQDPDGNTVGLFEG